MLIGGVAPWTLQRVLLPMIGYLDPRTYIMQVRWSELYLKPAFRPEQPVDWRFYLGILTQHLARNLLKENTEQCRPPLHSTSPKMRLQLYPLTTRKYLALDGKAY